MKTVPTVVMVLMLMCLAVSVSAQEEGGAVSASEVSASEVSASEVSASEVAASDEVAAEPEQEEPTFTINGSVKVQTGIFVPLLSTVFGGYENKAYDSTEAACDPVTHPFSGCTPKQHGQHAGSLSMFRTTLQLEADWKPSSSIAVHAILRGTRSLMTNADAYAQIPKPYRDSTLDSGKLSAIRKDAAKKYVLDNFYNTAELREFYVDAFLTNWLSFRIGRQQVTWGETGQFRLLDVINPIDNSWHFGPVESFRDTRIPLWIVKGMIEFPAIDHDLEIVWVPGLDRPQDMVTIPATLYGAWGLPYSSTPASFPIDEKEFQYPKNDIKDTMRIGARWRGSIGSRFSYSIVYYYTHLLSPPIIEYFQLGAVDGSLHVKKMALWFPRQHIAGFSLDYTLDYPWGTVIRFESAIEPNRTYQINSSAPGAYTVRDGKYYLNNPTKFAVSYALVLTRPTMIRFLNPTQNFTINLQWMHTILPWLSAHDKTNPMNDDKKKLIEIPGYNEYTVKTNDMRIILAIMTSYLNGLLTPRVVAAYLIPDAGFVSAELGVRLGNYWRLNFMVLDIFGGDPYKSLGLWRDRSELNMSILCQF